MASRETAEHILIGRRAASSAKDLFGAVAAFRAGARFPAAGAGRMVLVRPTTRHPRPAVTQRSLPLWSDLPQDGPGDGGGGPLLPVTLRSSGSVPVLARERKKMPRGVRPHPDGRPSDGGRDRRWREPLRRRRTLAAKTRSSLPAGSTGSRSSAGATNHAPKQTARVTLAAARSTPCCATARAGSPKPHEPSPPGHVRPQGA